MLSMAFPSSACSLSNTGSPQPGGSWTDPNGESHSGFFVPANNPEGDYTYTVSNNCGTASAVVTTTVDQLPDAGMDADSTLCFNAAAVDMMGILGGIPDTGGDWFAPDGNPTGNMFNPETDAEGIYWYRVTS